MLDANWSSVSIVHHQATPSILNLQVDNIPDFDDFNNHNQEILLAAGVEVLSRRLPRGTEVAGDVTIFLISRYCHSLVPSQYFGMQ